MSRKTIALVGEKQAAKIAWGVKIAAKIVERKVAQKRNRDKPLVRLKHLSRMKLFNAKPLVRLKAAKKLKTDSAKFGTDEEGNSNTPKNKKARTKHVQNKKKFGVNIDGESNVPSAEKQRTKLVIDVVELRRQLVESGSKGLVSGPAPEARSKQAEAAVAAETKRAFEDSQRQMERVMSSQSERFEKEKKIMEQAAKLKIEVRFDELSECAPSDTE